MIYRAYLDGRKTPFSEGFLAEFVEKRIEKMRESFLS